MLTTLSPSPRISTSVEIALLGPPQLRAVGVALSLPRRQNRALLYRLAAALQPVPREELCFLFWPDIPEASARRNLTVQLNQLRQALPNPELVLAGRDAVGLAAGAVRADTVVFAEALATDPRRADLGALAGAVELYRGPFLQGFSLPASEEFDAWADRERQFWERRYLDALAALVDGHAARREFPQAIGAAQRVLAHDELAEDMHRRLIELLAASGDRAAALRQFERCVVALERELGVSPLPETRAVYEAVRDGRVQLPAADAGTAPSFAGPALARPTPQTTAARLPAAPSPLIGRERELAETSQLLRDPSVRLLTLCGPGGSGKTRLALEAAWNAADDFTHGAVFVTLASIRDPDLLAHTIAQACGLKQASPHALADYLRGRQMLLVLDNCEHLLAAAPAIAQLLAGAPGLRMLVTSRSALGLQGEHTLQVPPLPLPDLADLPELPALADVPSVALLLARTRALNPRFALSAENAADLAAICVRLDGLPLAIELAAARLRMLAPRDLLRRLDRRLALLTSGARDLPGRQQTLRATIDWSYRLLDHEEQIFFEQLGVFVGGWSVEAAEALHAQLSWRPSEESAARVLDLLATLADKSLIQTHTADDGEMRFSMLETIREYAVEQLGRRSALDRVAQAHAQCFLGFIEQIEAAGVVANTPEWVARIELDHDNLRAALRFYLDHGGAEQAIQLGSGLHNFWYWRDYEREGRRWLEEIVERSAHIHTLARARLVYKAALLAGAQGEMDVAVGWYKESIRMCDTLPLASLHGSARGGLGLMLCRQGDYPQGIALMEESLEIAKQLNHRPLLCSASMNLAGVLADEGRQIERAIALYEESRAIARADGHLFMEASVLSGMGCAWALTGSYKRARGVLNEALRLQQDLKANGAIAWTLQFMGMLAYLESDYAQAQEQFRSSLVMAAHADSMNSIPMSLEGLAGVAAMARRPVQAARLLGAAEALRETLQIHLPPLERPYYERILSSVRAQLAAAPLREAWHSGRSLSTPQAIEAGREAGQLRLDASATHARAA